MKFHTQSNITATLRILKLSVKSGGTLRDLLEANFADTPTYPWKSIIPQLFCHLNHNEPSLRRVIADLLFRIAKDYPNLIIYPAVVGCQDGPTRIESAVGTAAVPAEEHATGHEKSPLPSVVQQQLIKETGADESGEEDLVSSDKSADEEVNF